MAVSRMRKKSTKPNPIKARNALRKTAPGKMTAKPKRMTSRPFGKPPKSAVKLKGESGMYLVPYADRLDHARWKPLRGGTPELHAATKYVADFERNRITGFITSVTGISAEGPTIIAWDICAECKRHVMHCNCMATRMPGAVVHVPKTREQILNHNLPEHLMQTDPPKSKKRMRRKSDAIDVKPAKRMRKGAAKSTGTNVVPITKARRMRKA